MSLPLRVLQYWRNKSITFKYGFGITLMLLQIVFVACTGYYALYYVAKANDSIRISNEIERLVFAMDRGMEKARRLHGGFFLHYPTEGLAGAHEKYAQPSIRQVAKVVANSKKLREMVLNAEVGSALRDNNINLNLYLSFAKRFAETSIESFELVARMAAPEEGLEERLDKYFSALKKELKGYSSFSDLYFEMETFVSEYRLRRERFLMQSAFNSSFSLRSQIKKESLVTEQQQKRMFQLLDDIKKTADEILDIDVGIKSKFEGFELQVKSVEAVSESLVAFAGSEVEKSQARIQMVYKISFTALFVVTLSGLIAAVFIAYILNANITQRVVVLTRSAEKFREGNLELIAEDGALDELGILGRTFNSMGIRLGELIDTMEKKVIERTKELADSERRFRQLFEHSISGVAVYQPVDNGQNFIIRDVNNAVEKIESVKRDDIIGKTVTDVFPGISEFGLLDVFRKVAEKGVSIKHPVTRYSDNRLQGWRENYVYRLPGGEIVAVYNDLTSEKQNEEKRKIMEQQLERAKKMEAIGVLAGGVAHDLNNILAGIVGYPELILEDLPEGSKLIEPLEAIHDSGQRATAVVADLLTVARSVANTKSDNNLNTIVTEYLSSPEYLKLKSTYRNISYFVDLFPELYHISCSPVHIKKCIMNLITNAVEAIEGNGRVEVTTHNESVNDEMAGKRGIHTGEFVVLQVTDTGPGIAKQNLEHIFEPFYTKKIMGRSGTGLGLAVVWNSMADHGGTVFVESSNKGTTFSLFFPALLQAVSEEEIETKEPENYRGNGEKILIIDDEPQLRNLAKHFLERFGYSIDCVSSGEEAVEYLKQKDADLLLLDMIMDPGMNGRQTFECILKIKPQQKAVVASGFSENFDVQKTIELGASAFILKPYSMTELAKVVRQTLNSDSNPD